MRTRDPSPARPQSPPRGDRPKLASELTKLRSEVDAARAEADDYTRRTIEACDELDATRRRAEDFLRGTTQTRYWFGEMKHSYGPYDDGSALYEDPYAEALDFMYDVAKICKDVLRCTEVAVERRKRTATMADEIEEVCGGLQGLMRDDVGDRGGEGEIRDGEDVEGGEDGDDEETEESDEENEGNGSGEDDEGEDSEYDGDEASWGDPDEESWCDTDEESISGDTRPNSFTGSGWTITRLPPAPGCRSLRIDVQRGILPGTMLREVLTMFCIL